MTVDLIPNDLMNKNLKAKDIFSNLITRSWSLEKHVKFANVPNKTVKKEED